MKLFPSPSLQLQKFRDELRNRSRVLKMLGYIDADSVVQLKGRAACLIDTGDELLVTELMFNGVSLHSTEYFFVLIFYRTVLVNYCNFVTGTFNDLDPHQVVALASCFIPGDKSSDQVFSRIELAKPLQQLQESARKIAEVRFVFIFYTFIF